MKLPVMNARQSLVPTVGLYAKVIGLKRGYKDGVFLTASEEPKLSFSLTDWAKFINCMNANGMKWEGEQSDFIVKENSEDTLEKFHIHEIGKVDDDKYIITKLLPKDSNFRGKGDKVNLLDYPVDEWSAAVQNMDSTTRDITAAFINCLKHFHNYSIA